ncbi:MAG: hypothetical protein IIA08_02165 [Proteobacteria bacterium]|nr:hypothetical protein [Pseudomonadota bacterium]
MQTVADVRRSALESLLCRYELQLILESECAAITGSFWGDSEAGIVGHTIYVSNDTPIHSLLHEACHAICMTGERRKDVDRNAGGDDLEESAVCYLQVVLADHIDTVGRDRLMQDMDTWGYSFRLGSTRAWFERDADDAIEFLTNHGLLTETGEATFKPRA